MQKMFTDGLHLCGFAMMDEKILDHSGTIIELNAMNDSDGLHLVLLAEMDTKMLSNCSRIVQREN